MSRLFNMRLTPEDDAALERVAKRFGASQSETVRRLIHSADGREPEPVAPSAPAPRSPTNTRVATSAEPGRYTVQVGPSRPGYGSRLKK